jgi:phosphoribosyl-ATP pyrophosphohydrolase
MPKYTFWRNAIIAESYEVTAASEEQAREKLFNGECDPIHTEWVDWATDSWDLEHVEDELVTFLNSKDPATVMDIG